MYDAQCVLVCVYAYMPAILYTHTHVCMHTLTCTWIHTLTHRHTQTHTHMTLLCMCIILNIKIYLLNHCKYNIITKVDPEFLIDRKRAKLLNSCLCLSKKLFIILNRSTHTIVYTMISPFTPLSRFFPPLAHSMCPSTMIMFSFSLMYLQIDLFLERFVKPLQ